MVSAIGQTVAGATLSLMVMGAGRPAAVREGPQGPPANLRAGAYQSVVEQMWRDSPTFRQQCITLAAAPELTVRIRGESRPSPSGVRSRTEISISRGRVTLADIVLMSPAETVELLAHELEHVVEAAEGVRLKDHGCTGTSMGHAQESCRAVAAGRRAAAEVQAARRQTGEKVIDRAQSSLSRASSRRP
jgi:hypothetical protein